MAKLRYGEKGIMGAEDMCGFFAILLFLKTTCIVSM